MTSVTGWLEAMAEWREVFAWARKPRSEVRGTAMVVCVCG